MYKVRSVLLLAFLTLLSACGGPVKTNVPYMLLTSTSNGPAPMAAATQAAVSTATPRPTLAVDEWKTLPIVPTVSDTVRAIYKRGLEMGNHPQVFSKVGDCQTSTDFFLVAFDHTGAYKLGTQYADLQSTIDYYHGSFSRQSEAVRDGFNVAAVVSSLRADPKQCNKGETPLACEIRLNHPSVALISLETNFNSRTADNYGKYMRQIIEYAISQGVVPIIATKADNKEGNNSINAEIAMIANEYDIPLWNFWRAVHNLPNNGFDLSLNDGFHLSLGQNYTFDDPKNMQAAWPWRNLTALQALDAVRNGLNK